MRGARHQCGAAILAAMVFVTLVATLASAAIAWQSKSVDIQVAERARVQALWLLRGALDWSRLLLRQDAQSAADVDHLAEPWAVPLQETSLTTFVQVEAGDSHNDASADVSSAFLAGAMEDLQSKINVAQVALQSPEDVQNNVLKRLFEALQLPTNEYLALVHGLQQTLLPVNSPDRLIRPHELADLLWLGVSPLTLEMLKPYVYWGSVKTKVNLNTASAIVIQAASGKLSFSQAQALVNARRQSHFENLKDAEQHLSGITLSSEIFTVKSQYFLAKGWLRMDEIALGLQAQLARSGTAVRTEEVSLQGLPRP